ncbi:DUF4185 domain-containing protein [Mycobacterium sp. SMC-4]|uniref:DUF4185 domain-containing protein n=1 Tax=Mycobacterium sp. SMC-4 TaxID=2857059 RepID=UPI0021B3B19D|nr:DUF4185 domain-containing protein [Mycobacterium sp. SMC-4]UXA17466.1 DUF4185 domain-containing protein [Mycobacterium sp. SMC-4]
MGAAAYVGRVGGLAVALGVGSAVFAGHGIAAADSGDSSSSRSSSSATTGSGGTDTSRPDRTRRNEQTTERRESGRTATTSADVELPIDAESDRELVEQPDEAEASDELVADEPDARPERRRATETVPTTESTVTQPERSTRADPDVAPQQTDTTSTGAADDPAVAPKEPTKVAVFVSATTLAEASTARVTSETAEVELPAADEQTATRRPTLATAVVNVVHSMLDWARQRAVADPASSPQPPFLWALMSFARRELENLFATRGTVTAGAADRAARTAASLALTENSTVGDAPAAARVQHSPWLNPQVSQSTNFVSWVTGRNTYTERRLANTVARFGVYGTDVGVMWDNGMVDDPNTPWNESQVLIAVGDTFSGPNMQGGWRYNTLFRSSDRDLSNGMEIPDGEWFNGNMFGGAPLSSPTFARPIINRPSWLPGSVTLIPTAGISVPTPDTQFGVTQYVSFMSVSRWGSAGRWTTNYSGIAYSTDNGENFTIARESIRYNSIFSGHRNFQQSAFVQGDDGYVYMYGTPNGRQGAAYLARVAPENILNAARYEYYRAGSSSWLGTTAARWVSGSPSSASAIIGKTGGACGATKPGYSVSEMSVQYNEYLGKYVVLYGDQFNNIVMRTADVPEGQWSEATVLMTQQPGGIYAPMLHPWSPSTAGTGSDLYWNLSLWSEYNIMLMRTDLAKL